MRPPSYEELLELRQAALGGRAALQRIHDLGQKAISDYRSKGELAPAELLAGVPEANRRIQKLNRALTWLEDLMRTAPRRSTDHDGND